MVSTSASLKSDATDLGALWNKAVIDYMKKTGNKMDQMQAQSIDDVMTSTEKELNSFSKFRHDGGTVDKVRSSFRNHLGDMQKCMNGVEKLSAAAGVFPPAMPVGIVFAACGHVLSAFEAASAAYDQVEEFFGHSGRFFERLSILEGQADPGPLALAIVRVFSAQLSICGIAQRMVRKKRVKHFFNALWNLDDPELTAAYAVMQGSIEELGETVGYASYSAIKTTQTNIGNIDKRIDELDANIGQFRASLREDVQILYANTLDLGAKVTEGLVSIQERQNEQALLARRQHEELLHALERRYSNQQDDTQGEPEPNSVENIGDKRMKALARIRMYFEERRDQYPGFRDALSATRTCHETIKQSHIDATTSWLIEEPEFKHWLGHTSSVLWVRGPNGIGKTFLVQSVIKKKLSEVRDRSTAAYFYLQSDLKALQSMELAFACMAMQIAESNSRYADQVAAKIKEDAAMPTQRPADSPTWERFFTSMFSNDDPPKSRLFLFFDGLDEVSDDQRSQLFKFLKDIQQSQVPISVLVTSRFDNISDLELLSPDTVDITKDKIMPTLKALTSRLISTLPRIKKWNKVVKKHIFRRVVKQADSMLYVEQMLWRLSSIGREAAALKALDSMPTSLHELYQLLLDECGRERSEKQYAALKCLFAWLTYSKRRLTLGEALDLVKYKFPDVNLDIEDELIGRSSRILELSHKTSLYQKVDQVIAAEELDDGDESVDEADLKLADQTSALLTFQDRSLQQYFQRVNEESADNASDLRTPSDVAHLDMLTTSIDVIMEIGKKGKRMHLGKYASESWHAHIGDLSVTDSSNDIVIQVVQTLYRIAVNSSAFFLSFNGYLHFSSGALYPPTSSDTKPWYEQISGWVHRASTLPDGSLPLEVKEWAAQSEEDLVLFPLAHSQFTAWINRWSQWEIEARFTALQLSVRTLKDRYSTESIRDPLEEILYIVQIFRPGDYDSATNRAIGATAYFLSLSLDESPAKKALEQQSIAYVSRSVEMLPDDNFEASCTLRILSDIHYRLGDPVQSLSYGCEALLALDKAESQGISTEDKKQFNPKYHRAWVLERRAKCLQALDRVPEALEAYKGMIGASLGFTATALIKITEFSEFSAHPSTEAMDLLKSSDSSVQKEFIYKLFAESLIPNNKGYSLLMRPAIRTGQIHLVLVWLQSLETISPTTYHYGASLSYSFKAQKARAYIYYNILNDVEKAKQVRRNILTTRAAINEQSFGRDLFDSWLGLEWMQHANIIYTQFQTTANISDKEEHLAEMRSMPIIYNDEFKDAYVGLLIANMLQVLGPAREYYHQMEEIFDTCMQGLEDGVSFNDGPSLRLLAKILSSVKGLEPDALTAYSLQYSILDHAVHKNDKASHKRSKSPSEAGIYDEDLLNFEYSCKRCQKSQIRWEDPQYMCLVCPDVDFCTMCLAKEKKANQRVKIRYVQDEENEVDDEIWNCHCDKTHRYIRGPMKGWKGVKNGVIRIGENQLPVTEWLKGLKEVRWKAAWEDYWLRQSRLGDICDDDEKK